MEPIQFAMQSGWKQAAAGAGVIADHFRLPWRFHARIVAARGADGA